VFQRTREPSRVSTHHRGSGSRDTALGVMRSAKRARSVAHSLAHHATSGLCYVHPHLGTHCRKHQRLHATVDLLQPEKSDVPGVWPGPLDLSLNALGRKFVDVLGKERIDVGYISGATALFQFYTGRWPSACLVRLNLADGKLISVAVGSNGRKAEVVTYDAS
jgi:hypothetical protein